MYGIHEHDLTQPCIPPGSVKFGAKLVLRAWGRRQIQCFDNAACTSLQPFVSRGQTERYIDVLTCCVSSSEACSRLLMTVMTSCLLGSIFPIRISPRSSELQAPLPKVGFRLGIHHTVQIFCLLHCSHFAAADRLFHFRQILTEFHNIFAAAVSTNLR